MNKIECISKINEYKELIKQAKEEDNLEKIKDLLKDSKKYINELQLIRNKEEVEVKKIIDKIKEEYNKDGRGLAETEFMESWCYCFAIMLKKIFKEDAHIYISSSGDIHAITKVYDSFYDVRGKITSQSNVNISEYHEPSNDEFLYFIDICNIQKDKKNVEKMEIRCDEIVEIILNDQYSNESEEIFRKIS